MPWSTLREVGVRAITSMSRSCRRPSRRAGTIDLCHPAPRADLAHRQMLGQRPPWPPRRCPVLRGRGERRPPHPVDTTSDVPGQARCGRARPDIRLCAAPRLRLAFRPRTAPGPADATVRRSPAAAVHESDGTPRAQARPSRPRSAPPAPRSHTRRERMDMTAKNLQELLDADRRHRRHAAQLPARHLHLPRGPVGVHQLAARAEGLAGDRRALRPDPPHGQPVHARARTRSSSSPTPASTASPTSR